MNMRDMGVSSAKGLKWGGEGGAPEQQSDTEITKQLKNKV